MFCSQDQMYKSNPNSLVNEVTLHAWNGDVASIMPLPLNVFACAPHEDYQVRIFGCIDGISKPRAVCTIHI